LASEITPRTAPRRVVIRHSEFSMTQDHVRHGNTGLVLKTKLIEELLICSQSTHFTLPYSLHDGMLLRFYLENTQSGPPLLQVTIPTSFDRRPCAWIILHSTTYDLRKSTLRTTRKNHRVSR
jgi:hypothetical protein